ncbi:MAG TPA: hypothetical protein VN688_34295 [Gemmataceae bacterium]|nr:hypothetical protein [Gemmataceae bacterium]
MSFSLIRLTPFFVVLATGFVSLPARAQFSGVGGLTAPVRFPSPVLRYGGYGYRGYGYGYGGYNLMQNPYAGYLNGAANLTTANAQYQLTIQQAKQAQEVARRSALQTRRDTLAERQYELSLMPDPEKIRQDQMTRALQRSRNNPPPTEIWSGKALNDLLRGIQTAQTRGTVGPDVPLAPDVLKHINLTTGTTYGGTGLLKDGGKLSWPYALRQSMFDTERTTLNEQMRQAVKQAQSGEVSVEVLNDVGASLKQLGTTIDAHVADLTPSQYIQATRYVRELKESYKVLQQNDVAKYFRPERTAQGSTVAELVRQMTQQGLRFGPAVSGEETYYTSLHQSMVDYDMGATQLNTAALGR